MCTKNKPDNVFVSCAGNKFIDHIDEKTAIISTRSIFGHLPTLLFHWDIFLAKPFCHDIFLQSNFAMTFSMKQFRPNSDI